MEDFLIVLVIFGTLFGIMYVYLTVRNKERLALIEKGADAKLFKSETKYSWKNFALSSGMFLVGIALGVILAGIIEATTTITAEVAYPSMIFLFAGLSLIFYFFLARKLKNGKQ